MRNRSVGSTLPVVVAAVLSMVGLLAVWAPAASATPTTAATAARPMAPPVTVNANAYPPLGVTVQTDPSTCDGAPFEGIAVGSQCEAGFAPEGFVNVVILNRSVSPDQPNGGGEPQVIAAEPSNPPAAFVEALWSCSSTSCTSPLQTLLGKYANGTYEIIINQPNNYGSACPSANLLQTPPCPGPSSASSLPNLVPRLPWSSSNPDALYQPWSIIYTPDSPACSTCEVTVNEDQTLGRTGYGADLPAGALSGNLELDENSDLVYSSTDYVPFDTLNPSAPAGTDQMEIDGRVLGSVTPTTGSTPESGFMVAVLSRADLSLESFETYITNNNPNGDIDSANGQLAMSDFLQSEAQSASDPLVAIQSFGTPGPESEVVSCGTSTSFCISAGGTSCGSNTNCGVYAAGPAWGRIGEALDLLGGTMTEFDGLNDSKITDQLNSAVNCSGGTASSCTLGDTEASDQFCGGYAFLGGVGVPNPYEIFGNDVHGVGGNCQSGLTKTASYPAELQGVLTRDVSSGLFEPYMASAVPSALNTSVMTMAYPAPGQAPAPFPTYTGYKLDAFNALVNAINNGVPNSRVTPDLRSEYWQDYQPLDWITDIGKVNGYNCGQLPKRDKCSKVRKELVKEMTMVRIIYTKFWSANSFLQKAELWNALGSGDKTDLQTLSSDIIADTTKTPSSVAVSALDITSAVFSAGASVAGLFGGPGAAIGAGLGVVSASLGVAGSIVGDDSGGPSSPFAGEIQTTAANLASTIQDSFGEAEYSILTTGEVFTTSLGALKEMYGLIQAGDLDSTQAAMTSTTKALQRAGLQTVYADLVPIAYGAGVGYNATNLGAVPGTVQVGHSLPTEMPGGCWYSGGGGWQENGWDTAEMPTSGPVLDNPLDPNPNGSGPPDDSLTTLVPEASYFFVQRGTTTNTCGSGPEWLGPSLFGPTSGQTVSPNGNLQNAGFSFEQFFDHEVPNCYVKQNNHGFVVPCGSQEGWPQFGTQTTGDL